MTATANLPAQREPRPAVAFSETGVQLRSLDEAFRFAQAVYESGIAPNGLRNAAGVMIVMQMGMELGYTPMQAIRNVWMGPDGRPNEYVESAWARVLASGLVEDWSDEVTDKYATFRVKRKGIKSETVRTFTMEQAERAGLVKPGSNWNKYRERMLPARAKGHAIKDAFPDVVRGMEIADRPSDDYFRGPDRAKDVTPPPGPDPLLQEINTMIADSSEAVGDGAAGGSETEVSDTGSPPAALLSEIKPVEKELFGE